MRIDEARRFKAEQRAMKGKGAEEQHFKATDKDIANL